MCRSNKSICFHIFPFYNSFLHCLSWYPFIISIAIVGDITPSDGVPKEEKSRREKAALNEMCEILGGGMRGNVNG